MPDIDNGIRFFKPSGEAMFIPDSDIVGFGPHEEMGGMVMRTTDDLIIHCNLPYMIVQERPEPQEEQEGGEEE